MPYSDHPPPIVMPDTADGHYEAGWKFPGVTVGFCPEWRSDYVSSRTCGNRRMEGDRSHNWCLRCLAGYPVIQLTDKEREETRFGAIRL